ncbi:MAG: YchJ family protein [Xanthomonadaceae bacterium]|nr:YchJ family protein [Xanthomonadaceae bacterium]
MNNCYCGNTKPYSECCEPYVTQKELAPSAEALMRARYSAHVVVNVPFLKESTAPEKRGEFVEKDVREWAKNSEWLGLKILKTKGNTVEFNATYKAQGKTIEHHEVAEFRKDAASGKWYFVDGDSHVHEEGQGHHHHESQKPIVREEPKIGRNDPCHCDSGKKFKKCHGA